MQSASVGIRDAKIHLSKYLKMVQQGIEVIITDRGRPVGKIIPISTKDLPLKERIKRMEDLGQIEVAANNSFKKLPPPIPVQEGIAQKLLQLVLISLIAVGFANAAEPEPTLEQILDRVEQHYTGKSFQAEFIQESSIKAMEIVDFAAGKIFVRYPGMMRWEYEKPEKQVITTDGQRLWIYRPADNQVLTGKAPAFFGDGKGASFLSDIKLIRKKFKISQDNSKNSFFYELNLQPLEKTLDVTDIGLSITKNTYTVVRVVTYNTYGDENRIEFANHQFNVKLDDSLFSFEVPPGAEVLQLNE